jgi:hypothetical protein
MLGGEVDLLSRSVRITDEDLADTVRRAAGETGMIGKRLM